MSISDVSDKTISQLISLEGRVAVVTGAAKGIGLGICRRFAEAGANVVLADIDKKGAEDSAAAIAQEFKVKAEAIVTDVRDEKAIVTLADTAAKSFGRLDIWVNNAGIFPGRATMDLPASEWDDVNATNLRGAFIGAREASRHMKAKGGVIINVASIAGVRGRGGLAAYSSSKHGLVGLTKSLAIEFGPHNIRVVGVAPTAVMTPGITARAKQGNADELARIKDMLEKMGASLPLGRIGVVDDVARVALFCASDMAMLVTGATIPVDAGAMLP